MEARVNELHMGDLHGFSRQAEAQRALHFARVVRHGLCARTGRCTKAPRKGRTRWPTSPVLRLVRCKSTWATIPMAFTPASVRPAPQTRTGCLTRLPSASCARDLESASAPRRPNLEDALDCAHSTGPRPAVEVRTDVLHRQAESLGNNRHCDVSRTHAVRIPGFTF